MKQRIAALGTRPEIWLWLLLAWVAVSAARCLHTRWAGVALTEMLRWGVGIVLALALGQWLMRARRMGRIVTGAAGLLALAGLVDGFHPGVGLVGPFHDHQLYASALLALLPLTLAVALTAREPKWRWGAQAVGLTSVVCLVLTETRSAWIGTVVAGLVFVFLWLRQRARFSGTRELTGPLLLAGGVAVAFILMVGTTALQKPLAQRVGTLGAVSQDNDWQGRLAVWQGAQRMVAAHPVAGWGLGQYPAEQWNYTQTGRLLTPGLRPSLSEEAHNFYLQTAAETGLIGLGLYLAVLAAFVGGILRHLNQWTFQRFGSREAFLIATLALIAGQAVDAFASPSWQFGEVSLLFWAALGIGLAALNRQESPETTSEALPYRLRRTGRLAVAGLAAVTFAAQVLPMGLLSPVEAYCPPPGYHLTLLEMRPDPVFAHAGESIPFTVTAYYKDKSGQKLKVDVTAQSHFSATLGHFTGNVYKFP